MAGPEPHSPSSAWEDVDDDEDSEELFGATIFPAMHNRVLTAGILGNNLRATDLRTALEAVAKYTCDTSIQLTSNDLPPPGWDEAKEFIGVLLQNAMEKFFRPDAFLKVHQDHPDQLFACMYYLCYACSGLASVLTPEIGDMYDQELCALLNATYTILDSRSAVNTLPCVRQLPNLVPLLSRTETYLNGQLAGQLSSGESDDDAPAPGPVDVVHLRGVEGGNLWQAYLVQLLVNLSFVQDLVEVLKAPQCHSIHLHGACLSILCLVARLMRAVVKRPLKEERRQLVQVGISSLLSWVATDLMADPEKLFSGRDRSAQALSHALSCCHELLDELQLPSTQVTVLQRRVVTEMLKSSNFARLLSAVQECGALLSVSLRRSRCHQRLMQEQEGEGEMPLPEFVGIEDNVRWLNQERIVKQMLRVNLHQSQYAEAVLGILRVLAECGHLNDEHLDMLWGVTEQEDTFDAVKTNVCHMIKQLAQHLRPQQLDLLFHKFENRKGRTLSDTLRLLDLLRRLAQSDTKKASSMAGKLVELVWELTTPADAPPELLNSGVMLDVLEGYRQHALLAEYIQRCVAQLRARTNVYTALTVLGNLLRLWGKLYGWEARQYTREDRRSVAPRTLADLLSSLDAEPPSGSAAAAAAAAAAAGGSWVPPNPPLSRLLVENLCDFMAGAARWLEERRGGGATATAAAATASGSLATGPSGGGVGSGVGVGGALLPANASSSGGGGVTHGSAMVVVTQPPGQGSYSYQQIVRRYLEVFRLVSQCKDTYVAPGLVEALWDAVVLRPNTPEDMPSGLDLILAFTGEVDPDAQAALLGTEGAEVFPGPLLELRDLCRLLTDRVARLPVENLGQPAFACFKACFQAAQRGLEDQLRSLAADAQQQRSSTDLGEEETRSLTDEVREKGQSYLWQIVQDCQRGDVTALASEMLIRDVYGSKGIHDLVSDARTRLMEAAAVLTSAPPGTSEWQDVELPADVMESPGWEVAKTRATRCLQLLDQLAAKSEDSMPPVPAHSASWQGPTLTLEVTHHDAGRIKLACTQNEYVGLLRRKVAQRLGADPACVRLVAAGQELKHDARTLAAALPSAWSSRQALLASVSPKANRYTRFGEEWWGHWHSTCTLAHMYHDDQLYRVLLLLADLPKAPGVRAAASRLLQQLPTCSWVPVELLAALLSDQPAARLRRMLLLGGGGGGGGGGPGAAAAGSAAQQQRPGEAAGCGVERPGLLLYTLQALYALLQPSYPPDLLPLAYKPWPPPTPSSAHHHRHHHRHHHHAAGQQHPQAAAEVGPLPPAGPHAAPGCGGLHSGAPGAVDAGGVAWWQVLASGGAPDRLLPVLARCVPLLGEVVDRVMEQVAAAAAAATGAVTVTGSPGPMAGPLEPGRAAAVAAAALAHPTDLAFVKDFQWVMVFLLTNIHNRARKSPSLDGGHPHGGHQQLLRGKAATHARPQPADSLSSSHGHEQPDGAGTSTAAVAAAPGSHRDVPMGPTHGPHHPAASGGQDSEVATHEAGAAGTAGGMYGGGGAGTAAAAGGAAGTPEVTSAEPEGEAASMQVTTQPGTEAPGEGPGRSGSACGFGPAGAAAAALVSGLAVSSRGSPAMESAAATAGDTVSYMDTSTPSRAGGAGGGDGTVVVAGLPGGVPASQSQPAMLLDVPVSASSTDVDMQTAPTAAVLALPAAAAPGGAQAAHPQPQPHTHSHANTGPSASGGGGGGDDDLGRMLSRTMTTEAAFAAQHIKGECALAGHGHSGGAVAGGVSGGGGSTVTIGDAYLRQHLGPDGLRCLMSLLIRTAHDAGCLWGYGPLLTVQQQAAAAGRLPTAAALGAAAATGGGGSGGVGVGVPSFGALCSAAEVAFKLASKALQVLGRLVQWPDLRDAFLEDPRTLPMLFETLSCEFSPGIRENALGQLEGLLACPQAPLPPGHFTWVLRELVGLRPALEGRLDSCLEFHQLLAKVVSQLPELASASAEARLLADGVLVEEVARLDVRAEELLEPRRAVLLRGKLVLIRELVRALDRLGLGLGANGRPGLISILLNRYLFPEAQPLWLPFPSHLDMEDALQHVAADPLVRREGLALVQFLLTGCPANLEQGYRDLRRLHFDNGLRAMDRKFDIAGEGVRPGPDPACGRPSTSGGGGPPGVTPSLSSSSSASSASFVGLRNGGATCYMNSVLQQLFMQPRIRELVLGAGAVDPEDQHDSVFHQLQVLFAHLALGRASCFNPRGFWHSFKDYDGQPIDVREHQDAYEFFTRLQDSVDSYLRATGQPPAMQAVMGGKFAAQIICKDVNYRSEREEEFYQVSVEVKGFSSLEKSLEGYVAGELMEGENSYYCEELGARVAAVRRTVIKELPQTLVIHLKRFEYDHLNMTRYKLRDRFEFPVVLDMFKYTADGIAALEATGAGPAAGAAGGSTGAAAGAGGGAGPGLGEGAGGGAAALGDGAGRPRNSYLYELKGVVVHSGTAFAGHYYSFIKERPRLGEDGQVTDGGWFRFDDKVVTPWSIQDLEDDCFGGRPPASSTGGNARADPERPYSAYMLFYERRDAASYERSPAERRAVPRDLAMAVPAAAGPSGGAGWGAGADAGPAAAAEAVGQDGLDGMDTDVPQRRSEAGAAGPLDGPPTAAAATGGTEGAGGGGYPGAEDPAGPGRPVAAAANTTPYGMPVLLYESVLRDNLQLMHKLHVLNKEYFAFVRQVVEVTWETVLAGRKTRRRDHNHHNHQQLPGGGSGAQPSVSPHTAAATPTTLTGTTGSAAGSGAATESSSAPSQRNEELDETVLLSARLAAAFLINVYIPAPPALRADLAQWRDLLFHLLQACPRACVELLRLVASSPPALDFYFVRSGQHGIFLAEVVAFAVQAAGRAAAPGGGADEPAAAPGQPLQQQLQSAAGQLTGVLANLLFGPMHDSERSEPQHLPLCRALAALACHDVGSAWALLNHHLADAFRLPGVLLNDVGAANDADMLPDLSASLALVHAICQYCFHRINATPNPPPMTAAAAAAARHAPAAPAGAAPPAPHVYKDPVVVMVPLTAAAAVAPPRPQLYDLTPQLDELVDGFLFEAAMAHSGLLTQPHVTELVHFLTAGSPRTSLAFLNALLEKMSEAEICGGVVVEMLDGLPAALAVYDALWQGRIYTLLFGGAASGMQGSLARMAAQAVSRQQTLSWLGLVVAIAIANVYGSNEAIRTVVRNEQIASLSAFISNVVVLARQLGEFAQLQAERAGSAGGGGAAGGGGGGNARDSAAAASAVLAARARRASQQLQVLIQDCLPVIQAEQRQRQAAAARAAAAAAQSGQVTQPPAQGNQRPQGNQNHHQRQPQPQPQHPQAPQRRAEPPAHPPQRFESPWAAVAGAAAAARGGGDEDLDEEPVEFEVVAPEQLRGDEDEDEEGGPTGQWRQRGWGRGVYIPEQAAGGQGPVRMYNNDDDGDGDGDGEPVSGEGCDEGESGGAEGDAEALCGSTSSSSGGGDAEPDAEDGEGDGESEMQQDATPGEEGADEGGAGP